MKYLAAAAAASLAVASTASPELLAAPGASIPLRGTHSLLAQATATDDEAPVDLKACVNEIKLEGDQADLTIFHKIAEVGGSPALSALKQCSSHVTAFHLRWHLLDSVREVAVKAAPTDQGLVSKCSVWVAKQCRSKDPSIADVAIGALVRFRALGREGAAKLIRSRVDEEIKAQALSCLIEWSIEQGRVGYFDEIVEHYARHTPTSPQRLAELLANMDSKQEIRQLYRATLAKESSPKLRDAMVRAIETIGTDRARASLVSLLDDSSAFDERYRSRIQGSLIDALERLGETGHHRILDELANGPPAVAVPARAALIKHQGVDGLWYENTFSELADESVGVRVRSLEVLKRLIADGVCAVSEPEIVAAIEGALADTSLSVRYWALRFILNDRLKPFVPLLFAAVGEGEANERDEFQEALELLTGEDHGQSTGRWWSWWKAEGQQADLPTLEDAREMRRQRMVKRNQAKRTSFYGLNLADDNVCLVIDASGSMQQENYWGESRFEIAQQQTIGAIGRLPDGARFNVIFFGTTVQRWKDEMVAADPDTREAVTQYVESLEYLGGTAIYDALELAFMDESVEHIYLLSDGEPSMGKVTDPDKIAKAVRNWNQKNKVHLHCISIGYRSAFMEELAAENGGQFRVGE